MAVILPSAYRDGTTSVAQGSDTVEGQGTLFRLSVLPGDWYSTDDGFFIMISEVVSDTELKLIAPYPGASITTQKYSIMLQSDIARMQETTRQLLETLRNGNLVAFAGLVGSVDKIPMFTGPGAMTLVDRYELTRGFKYDAVVSNMAGLSVHSGAAANFVVLVEDADGNGRSAFVVKRSANDGDWTDPIFITGEKGDIGNPGPYTQIVPGTTTTLPAGSDATVTPRDVSSGVVAFDFGVPKGMDGTGNGDVIGPDGGVVDGRPVAWDGSTGKFIKPIAGALQALHALTPSNNTFPWFSGATTAALADLTPFARTLLDDVDGAAMFATLGTTQFLGADGFIRFPNGIMIQWGQRIPTSGSSVVLFPTAFPNAVYRVIVGSDIDNNTTVDAYVNWSSLASLTGFRLNGRFVVNGGFVGLGGVPANFIAIGR